MVEPPEPPELPELPDDLWDLILSLLAASGLAWHRIVAQGVCRRFRAALGAGFVADTPASVHYPGMGMHAATSLTSLLALNTPAVPLAASLRSAVRRRCSLCGGRFAGKFLHFTPGLAVYAHPACMRSACVSTYWVEHPEAPGAADRLGARLHAACAAAEPGALHSLPRWTLFGYRRGVGHYSFSILPLESPAGVVPAEASVRGALGLGPHLLDVT